MRRTFFVMGKTMSKIESEIFKLETQSLFRHASRVGLSPEELIKRTLNLFYSRRIERDSSSNGILSFNDTIRDWNIELNNYSLDYFINLSKKSINAFRKELINGFSRFLIKNENHFEKKLSILKRKAQHIEINTNKNDWIDDFLYRIPIIQSFDRDFDAYIYEHFPNQPIIIFTRSLHDSLDRFIYPAIINSIWTEDENGMIANKLTDINSFDFSKIISVIHEVVQFYLGSISHNELNFDTEILEISKPVSFFNFLFTDGAMEFILGHEYSHIVLGHEQSSINKLDEISSDVLSMNVLTNRFYEIICASGADELFSFKSISVIILMYILITAETISGFKERPSHPHPWIRMKYLVHVCKILSIHTESSISSYNDLIFIITKIFSDLFSRFNIQDKLINFIKLHDESFIYNYEFSVFPANNTPVFFKVNPTR